MSVEFNEKQIEILLVAEQLFAEEGFDGTSVREIAKIANINIAIISIVIVVLINEAFMKFESFIIK